LLWLVGVALLLIQLLFGYNVLNTIKKSLKAVKDPALLKLLDQHKDQVKKATLYQSSRLAVPIALDIKHQKIILPDEALNWTSERQQSVLLHEMAHIKRKDWLFNTIYQPINSLVHHPEILLDSLKNLKNYEFSDVYPECYTYSNELKI
jgi:bla regulator protein BlaR1